MVPGESRIITKRDFCENSWLLGPQEKNVNFDKLYTIMQKWTPLSVSASLIVLLSVAVIAIMTFRNETVPMWAIEILSIFGTVLGATGLISHGATIGSSSATTAASETAKTVISQTVPDLPNANSEAKNETP